MNAPTESGSFTVRCIIKDSAGQTVTSDSATLTAKEVPLAVKIVQPQDVTAEAGETVRFTVEVTGGQAPYTYTWENLYGRIWRMFRNTELHSGQGTDTLVCTPNDVGTITYHCVIKDCAGNTVTSYPVSVTVKPLAVQINNGETRISLSYSGFGETKVLTANVTGGVGPYTYAWYRYQYNVNTQKYEFVKVSETSSFTADTSPRQGHRVKVEVTDSAGTTVTTEIYIEVTDIVN